MIREIIVFVFWTKQIFFSGIHTFMKKKMAPFMGQRFEQIFKRVLKYRGSCILSENSVEYIIKHFLIFSQSNFSTG